MLRGHRSVFLAFVGLALIGAAPKPDNKNAGEQSQPKAETSQSRAATGKLIVPSMPVTQAPVLERPCHEGQDNRQSDLCAQWKAADAANKAAWWAAFGTIVAMIGTAGLYWQIVLTRKAVEDTAEATRAMREANEIAKIGAEATAKAFRLQAASSRPLVIFDIENALFEGPPFGPPWGDSENRLDHHIRPTFSFKNIGSQPCWIESAWLTFYIKERDYKGVTSDEGGTLILPDGLSDCFRVANSGFVQPGQSINCGGGFYSVQKAEIEIIEKGGGVIVFGMCQYRSLAGDIHCTRYAFHVPIQRPHNTSLDRGQPVVNSSYWRDGLVNAAKLDHSDPVIWIDE